MNLLKTVKGKIEAYKENERRKLDRKTELQDQRRWLTTDVNNTIDNIRALLKEKENKLMETQLEANIDYMVFGKKGNIDSRYKEMKLVFEEMEKQLIEKK